MKILITGAGGLVGRALTTHCLQTNDEVVALDHHSLDISDRDRVLATIAAARPEVVINCAAWTDVDGCEANPVRSDAVNALGPENLALASRKAEALLITISTDYVFDGFKEGFYTQRDDPNPLSVYGRSKLDGERRAQTHCARTIIVRTGFIFGEGGRNFLSTVVDRVHHGEKVKSINDAWGTPTYARDLAVRLRELAHLDLPGIFHVVGSGEGASYATFVDEALALAGLDGSNIEDVSFASLDRPAPRPRNSRLKCLLSAALNLKPLAPWQDALAHYIKQTKQNRRQTANLLAN